MPATTRITSFFCVAESTAPQIFPQSFLNQNLSNNLSILPDLDSYRISILRRTYLVTFSVVLSVLYQILCLTFFQLEIIILALWRNVNFRSFMRMFVKQAMSLKRLVLMVNSHCKYITHYFSCCCFKCLLFPFLCWFLFLFLRHVEGRNAIATLF